jgi:hypothetical protein
VRASCLHSTLDRLETVAPGQPNELDPQRLGRVAVDVGSDADDRRDYFLGDWNVISVTCPWYVVASAFTAFLKSAHFVGVHPCGGMVMVTLWVTPLPGWSSLIAAPPC